MNPSPPSTPPSRPDVPAVPRPDVFTPSAPPAPAEATWAIPAPRSSIGEWPLARWTIPETLVVFLAAFGMQYFVYVFIGGTLGLSGRGAETIAGILSELVLVGTVFAWLRWTRRSPISSLSFYGASSRGSPGSFARRTFGDVGFGLLTGLGLVFLSGLVALATNGIARAILGHKPAPPPSQTDIVSGGWVVPAVLLIVVFAPICEETLFRGFLFQGLRRRFRVLPAALISAAAFGYVHVHLLRIPAIFVTGILLALLYERRRSLLASITAHLTFNAVVIAIVLSRR